MRPVEQSGLVVRQKSPLNLEFQFFTLSDWLIPTDPFYVRSHLPSPELHTEEWRLRIDGAVETPVELTLDALKTTPSTTLTAVMDCAGEFNKGAGTRV